MPPPETFELTRLNAITAKVAPTFLDTWKIGPRRKKKAPKCQHKIPPSRSTKQTCSLLSWANQSYPTSRIQTSSLCWAYNSQEVSSSSSPDAVYDYLVSIGVFEDRAHGKQRSESRVLNTTRPAGHVATLSVSAPASFKKENRHTWEISFGIIIVFGVGTPLC